MRGDEAVEIPPLVWERLATVRPSIGAPSKQAAEALRPWAEREQRSLERAGEVLRRWGEPLAETLRAAAKVCARIPPPTEAEVRALRCYRAALDRGAADRRARPWLHLGALLLSQLADVAAYLPDPAVRKGRPKGSSPAVTMMVAEVRERVAKGQDRATAAREVLKLNGVSGRPQGPSGPSSAPVEARTVKAQRFLIGPN